MPFDRNVIHAQPITIEESPVVLDLWIGSARWLRNKAIDQWDPDSFQIEQIMEYVHKGAEVLLARVNEHIVGTLIICWSDPEIWEELDTIEAAYIHNLRFIESTQAVGWALEY